MKNKLSFKLGTRGSLLAVTQSTITKNTITQLTGHSIELEKIVTQGDKITDVPLWQIDGKDFFTKELDQALLAKNVDFVVHSYKDLGSERPPGIELAAITKRNYAHDILLLKNSTIASLSSKKEFKVGTSSPRRQKNIHSHLADFLPNTSPELKVFCENLRGNVNTRIQQLKDDKYDAIVLALAGVERLAHQPESLAQLKELLQDLNFMILPQEFFTSSASQGALALECHEQASSDLKTALKAVHNEQSSREIQQEREAFHKYGGGCHLAVGIFVKKIHDYFLHIHRGTVDNKEIQKLELSGFDYTALKGLTSFCLKGESDFLITKKPIQQKISGGHIFVTSSLCSHNLPKNTSSLWASGNIAMKKLIQAGQWVQASAESLGPELILELKNSQALKLMLPEDKWLTFSHRDAKSSVGEVIGCYSHELNETYDKNLEDQMMKSDIIFWSSSIQFDHYTKKYPQLKSKKHACGLGKTYGILKEQVTGLIPCLSYEYLLSQTQENS